MHIADKIVQGFVAGDRQTFQALYALTSKHLYGLILRMTGNQQEAEDIAQDVYIRIFEKRHTFKGEKAGLYTWMYRIAVNHTLNRLRTKQCCHKDVLFEPQVEDSLAALIESEDVLLVQVILEKMNPDFKACLVLCELEHKPYEEIAALLKISIGTVRSRINRGRSQLKKMFKDQGGEL